MHSPVTSVIFIIHSLPQAVNRPAGEGMQPLSKSVASLLGGGVHSPVTIYSLPEAVSRPAGEGMQPLSKSVASLLGGGVHSPVTCVISISNTFTSAGREPTCRRRHAASVQERGIPPRRWRALSCYMCNLFIKYIHFRRP